MTVARCSVILSVSTLRSVSQNFVKEGGVLVLLGVRTPRGSRMETVDGLNHL